MTSPPRRSPVPVSSRGGDLGGAPPAPAPSASQKHLEFQLQREKTLVSSLQEKCKEYHSNVSRLEQEKAELRRERLALQEENKKSQKAEDHLASLRREVELRDKQLMEERQTVKALQSDLEEVRRDAHVSIRQWADRESELNEVVEKLRSVVAKQKTELASLTANWKAGQTSQEDVEAQLRRERERCAQLNSRIESMEKATRHQYELLEEHRNKIFTSERDLAAANRKNEALQEALEAQAVETKFQECEVERLGKEMERVTSHLSAMQDRLNSEKSKMMDLNAQKESLLCDLSEAKKEKGRLQLFIASEQKEKEIAVQRQSNAEQQTAEARERLAKLQKDLTDKQAQLRKQDLESSQVTQEMHRVMSQSASQAATQRQYEKEKEYLQAQLRQQQGQTSAAEAECERLQREIQQLQLGVERQSEAMVLSQNAVEEDLAAQQRHVQQLEQDVAARQGMISNLTTQMGEMVSRLAQAQHALLQQNILAEALEEKVSLTATESHERQQLLGVYVASLWNALHASAEAGQSDRAQLVATTERLAALRSEREVTGDQLLMLDERCQALLMSNEKLHRRLQEVESQRDEEQQQRAQWVEQLQQVERERESQASQEAARGAAHQLALEGLQRVSIAQLAHIAEATRTLEAAMSAKVALVWEAATVVSGGAHREQGRLRAGAAELTAKIAGLEQLLQQSSELLAEQREKAEQTIQSLTSTCAQLEERLARETTTKTQLVAQSHEILERFVAEKKRVGEAEEGWKRRLATNEEQHKVALEQATRELSRVREGLMYEVNRKVEYKKALEEVKALRVEGDRNRREEKQLAATAIQKAADETTYWREQHEELKKKLSSYRKRLDVARYKPPTQSRASSPCMPPHAGGSYATSSLSRSPVPYAAYEASHSISQPQPTRISTSSVSPPPPPCFKRESANVALCPRSVNLTANFIHAGKQQPSTSPVPQLRSAMKRVRYEDD